MCLILSFVYSFSHDCLGVFVLTAICSGTRIIRVWQDFAASQPMEMQMLICHLIQSELEHLKMLVILSRQ